MTTLEAPPVTHPALPSNEELEQYRDLWVAVSDGAVVGWGKTLRTAIRRANAKGFENPIVFRAPLRREGRAYY